MICGSRCRSWRSVLSARRPPRESGARLPIPLRPPAHDGPGVRYRDAIAALDRALPDGTDIVVDAGNTGAAAIHNLPVRRDGRFLVALGMGGMGTASGPASAWRSARPAHRCDRRRRLVLHARHGDSHRDPIPVADHLRAVQQQRPRHVCDPRATVLRRAVQLQPVPAQPARRRAGAMFPSLRVGRCRGVGELPAALVHALAVDGPSVVSIACSADEIPPFAPFLAAVPTRFTILQLTKGTRTMSLPALDDIAGPDRSTGDPYRDESAGEGHPDHHGDDAVGVPARAGLRRVLHRQRIRRLPARRTLRVPVRHPQPGGVDLQPARVHPHRRTRAVAGLRPARHRRRGSTPAQSPTRTRVPSTTTAHGTRATTSG